MWRTGSNWLPSGTMFLEALRANRRVVLVLTNQRRARFVCKRLTNGDDLQTNPGLRQQTFRLFPALAFRLEHWLGGQ